MKKALYIICFTALVLPALAQTANETNSPHKGPNAAVRKYIKEQVMPVLIQKRQQFDRELSAAEKTEIEQCRATLKQLQSQHHDWKNKEQNNASQDNTYYGQDRKANPEFEQRKAIMQRLQVIADNHSNSLQDIKTQLEPARKQWVSDIKKLMPAPANSDQKTADASQQKWHHNPGFEGFLNPHHLGARFLLLPTSLAAASDDPSSEGELKSDVVTPAGNSAAAVTGLTNFELMPNPASNDIQLGNDALPATNILKVIDLQGKEVLTLENVQPAQHLDVSQLANGTYIVQINSGDQTVSKKIVISR